MATLFILNYYVAEQSKALYGYSLTLLDTNKENTELATAILNQAIGKYPKNYPAHISLASIYEDKHFVDLALLTYKEALEYCPQTTDIEKSDAVYIKNKIDELSTLDKQSGDNRGQTPFFR